MNHYKTNIDTENLPVVAEAASMYFAVQSIRDDKKYIHLLENTVSLNDDVIADWLNITPRTYRNYKTKDVALKNNIKEHIFMLLSLYQHGKKVFTTLRNFEKWLSSPNQLLDNMIPSDFLNTISGIRFIDERLTAIEFGENI